MTFGARLAEERKRLGYKQAEFAALAGTDVQKQSLYENDRRALRAAYLARAAAAGIDPLYVLTGRRQTGAFLGDDATALFSAYFSLPAELQPIVVRFVEELTGRMGGEAPPAGDEGEGGEP